MHTTGTEPDHRTQETPKAHRSPSFREKDTEESTTVATSRRSAKAAPPATRTESKWRRSTRARSHAKNPNASANSNAVGECHPIRVTVAASQQNTGCVNVRPSHCTGGQRKNGPNTNTNESLREPVQERQSRRSQQNQGRSNGHKKNMLHHMDRKQIVIKDRKRRSDGNPKSKHSTHKTRQLPR